MIQAGEGKEYVDLNYVKPVHDRNRLGSLLELCQRRGVCMKICRIVEKQNSGVRSAPALKTAGQIEIETFGARFQNLPLLGFALQIRTGKM